MFNAALFEAVAAAKTYQWGDEPFLQPAAAAALVGIIVKPIKAVAASAKTKFLYMVFPFFFHYGYGNNFGQAFRLVMRQASHRIEDYVVFTCLP